MKPETEQLMAAARELLDEARSIAAIGIWTQVGRGAYSAALQSARAYIFERSGMISKTHTGTRARFAELTLNTPDFPSDLRGFLGRSHALKNAADYEIGPKRQIPADRAIAALETATRFVDRIAEALAE